MEIARKIYGVEKRNALLMATTTNIRQTDTIVVAIKAENCTWRQERKNKTREIENE